MPFKSEKQRRLFQAIAAGKIKPEKGRPSKAVAEEFIRADKRKKAQSTDSNN